LPCSGRRPRVSKPPDCCCRRCSNITNVVISRWLRQKSADERK
jgi:hypothetical protein